jgi:hypothetical protein
MTDVRQFDCGNDVTGAKTGAITLRGVASPD